MIPMKKLSVPSWIEPMRATLTDRRFSEKGWIFEPKLDGERCLAFKSSRTVRLYSANHHPINVQYPDLQESIAALKVKDAVFDGEVVAFEGEKTSFAKLQKRMHLSSVAAARASDVSVFYYIFDLLFIDGRRLTDHPLKERKALLQKIKLTKPLVYMSHLEEEGERYYAEACRRGWEGLIAKKQDSLYISGRSREWLKLKCILEQEFVVGGYSDPEGARSGFGALLLGYYLNGSLLYAGKVGTGYDHEMLERLSGKLKTLETLRCPFANYAASLRGVHWVRPVLVAQVGFAEWTPDGKLRQGRFLGLRRDKAPQAVTREISVA
jgi:bifunctional non-homologous end joining protein LigD